MATYSYTVINGVKLLNLMSDEEIDLRANPKKYGYEGFCDLCDKPHTKAQYTPAGECKLWAWKRDVEQRFWEQAQEDYAQRQSELSDEEQNRQWNIGAHYGDAVNKQNKENPPCDYRKDNGR